VYAVAKGHRSREIIGAGPWTIIITGAINNNTTVRIRIVVSRSVAYIYYIGS
jgi:hypothetical protein